MKATDVTVQDFIGGLKKAFIIPPYQRNYAWGEAEITQLIQDIVDYYKKDNKLIAEKLILAKTAAVRSKK